MMNPARPRRFSSARKAARRGAPCEGSVVSAKDWNAVWCSMQAKLVPRGWRLKRRGRLFRSLGAMHFAIDAGGDAEAALEGADQVVGTGETGAPSNLRQIKGSCFEQTAGGIEPQALDELGGG